MNPTKDRTNVWRQPLRRNHCRHDVCLDCPMALGFLLSEALQLSRHTIIMIILRPQGAKREGRGDVYRSCAHVR